MDLALGNDERQVKYSITLPRHKGGDKIERSFWVPKIGQTFRIMFHSCNGFVPGADKQVNGLALWNDVLRLHEKSPLHVMIGGGDQIYSDGIMEPHAPLYPWGQELSPRKRAKIPFPLELRDKVDDWYFQHHCDWFNASPFREANSQIPQLNLWDDHDIVGKATKPQREKEASSKEENASKVNGSDTANGNGVENGKENGAANGKHEEGEEELDPSYIRHPQQGPYIQHRGLSICTSLGEGVLFYGLDCRTDRTRERICYADTYQIMFDRFIPPTCMG
ncbi:transcription factor btf3 [Ceratobasidium sp. AG-Ba]|nr:transcription factor btf3 [Ceratobasidium sp. AG-Ba]